MELQICNKMYRVLPHLSISLKLNLQINNNTNAFRKEHKKQPQRLEIKTKNMIRSDDQIRQYQRIIHQECTKREQ